VCVCVFLCVCGLVMMMVEEGGTKKEQGRRASFRRVCVCVCVCREGEGRRG
jgi:hypothetical protein